MKLWEYRLPINIKDYVVNYYIHLYKINGKEPDNWNQFVDYVIKTYHYNNINYTHSYKIQVLYNSFIKPFIREEKLKELGI